MADDEAVEPQAGELTTANYGWVKPTVGSSDDAWGGYINSDLDGIDTTVFSLSTTVTGKLSLTGGAVTGTTSFAGGITFGSNLASPANSLAKHLALYGASYGFNVINGNLQAIANGGAVAQFSATGVQGAIGATTPSTGAFTNLSASGTVSGAGFTSLLAPYALTASVPVASTTTPAMDGTAAVGTGAAWARADHVHPSDTSRYAASNPSGYQTAAQVTASLASYLPLAGGTLTGALGGTTATFSGLITGSPTVIAKAGAGNANFQCQDSSGAAKASFYWDSATPAVRMHNPGPNQGLYIDSTGMCAATASMYAGTGYRCHAGSAGVLRSNVFNIDWTSVAQLWVDSTNLGTITTSSDYRIKKDVEPLPSMWERAKALRPISYTHKDYTPPTAPLKEDGSPADPLIVADDTEHWGFIAHELQETLIASAATGVKDQPDAIQSPNPWTVIAMLTKALQEAMARIEALEAARG